MVQATVSVSSGRQSGLEHAPEVAGAMAKQRQADTSVLVPENPGKPTSRTGRCALELKQAFRRHPCERTAARERDARSEHPEQFTGYCSNSPMAPRRTVRSSTSVMATWGPWRVPAGVIQKVPASHRRPPVSTVPLRTMTYSSAGCVWTGMTVPRASRAR